MIGLATLDGTHVYARVVQGGSRDAKQRRLVQHACMALTLSYLGLGCGYSPPPILRVGGGVTPLLIYDAHSGRGFGRGQNMAARNLKPKGKKTL